VRAGQEGAAPRPILSMGGGEAEEARVRSVLGSRYALVLDTAQTCATRLVGPIELDREGARLLRRHRLRSPGIPVVVICPDAAPGSLVRDCFREGAADVLASDEIERGLPQAIDRLLQRRSAGDDHDSEAQLMAAELGKRARDLEAALAAVQASYAQTLNALVSALDAREHETAHHSQRVAIYSIMLGVRRGLDESALESLFRGALLHDIGKIGIPDAVLLKPGSFTPDEWEIMRQHTEIGGGILSGVAFLREAADVPRCHHEAWNGTGYPGGLMGEGIPLNARIFAVVDTYDAIRSERPYKSAQPHGRAIELIHDASESRLDPRLVQLFCAEPESTWARLDESVGGSITFEASLQACHKISTP